MPNGLMESWLRMLGKEEIIPPFCVELVMKDGRCLYLHSGGFDDRESDDLTLRVWDLRAFGPKDLDELRQALSKVKSRSELANEQSVHPKLDWAILRAHLSDVQYCVEWHDRLWPEDARPKLGFTASRSAVGFGR